ncbi:hypothetical protein H312_01026 [Anncaliia algerae PRA339]|uniref:Uncharacterized protein n=1 Tax=Anncaliia algerae PRA339 TaxID=1288291 RepID=A0A059F3C5_9MICR|nr:hypothetical protein H312_01026 [Anncaliia algerae PRA339]
MGLILRRTKEFRCVLTRSRNDFSCLSLISANIAPGSTIMSDKWRGYIGLRKLGFNHYSADHKYEFVDQNNWKINI